MVVSCTLPVWVWLCQGCEAASVAAPRRGPAQAVSAPRGTPPEPRPAVALGQEGPLAPGAWSRRPGVWFAAPTPDASVSGVVREGAGWRWEFHGNTAIRLDQAVGPDGAGRYAIAFRVNPVVGETASLGWVSVIFTADPESYGWVTRPDTAPGLLVRSNGALQLFHHGVERAVQWTRGAPEPAGEYLVALSIAVVEDASGARKVLDGSVNGSVFHAVLAEGGDATLPARGWWLFGAHFHPGTVTESWLDGVTVPARDRVTAQ